MTNEELTSRTFPKRADTVLKDSSFRDDHPDTWTRYRATRTARKVGRGFAITVTLPAEDWARIARYLDSKAGALEAAIGDVGDSADRADLKAVRAALKRIDA